MEPTVHDHKAILSKAISRMARHLNLTGKELVEIIGKSEATFSRILNASSNTNVRTKTYLDPNSKEGQLAILLLRVYRNLDTLFGGNTKYCELWLKSENHHLHGKPIEVIKTIEGMIIVVQYLDAMRGKV